MAKYINRDELLKAAWDKPTLSLSVYDIGNIKPVDVAPVRHGRWEWCKDYDGDSILVCSECGRVCHEEDAPYCYCGAKMNLPDECEQDVER